jgi:hypothetical protein
MVMLQIIIIMLQIIISILGFEKRRTREMKKMRGLTTTATTATTTDFRILSRIQIRNQRIKIYEQITIEIFRGNKNTTSSNLIKNRS